MQVMNGGVCKTCLRPYRDRMWSTPEFLKQNSLDGGSDKTKWHADWLATRDQLKPCPLNCKWVVEFADADHTDGRSGL